MVNGCLGRRFFIKDTFSEITLQVFFGLMWVLSLFCLPFGVKASPWLESHDPFLRASLNQLSNIGLMSSPVSTFPLRWLSIGDDLVNNHISEEQALVANRQLRHAMSNAQYGRGKFMSKVKYQTGPLVSLGYGANDSDRWGIYSSYDHLDDRFAYRLNLNYVNQRISQQDFLSIEYDQDIDFSGSYIAFNVGYSLVALGYLERWWGPTWQHNLQLGTYGNSTPSLSVSWVSNNQGLIGYWQLDSVISETDSEADYLWSNRFSMKPFNFAEVSLNYHESTDFDSSASYRSFGVDFKVPLPKVFELSHAMFASFQKVAFGQETQSFVVGWEGHRRLLDIDWTLVLESQHVDEAYVQVLHPKEYELISDLTSLSWGNSQSVAVYAQLDNDHRLSIVARDSGSSNGQERVMKTDYYIPYLQGMFNLGVGYRDVVSDTYSKNEPIFSFGYEYRY